MYCASRRCRGRNVRHCANAREEPPTQPPPVVQEHPPHAPARPLSTKERRHVRSASFVAASHRGTFHKRNERQRDEAAGRGCGNERESVMKLAASPFRDDKTQREADLESSELNKKGGWTCGRCSGCYTHSVEQEGSIMTESKRGEKKAAPSLSVFCSSLNFP